MWKGWETPSAKGGGETKDGGMHEIKHFMINIIIEYHYIKIKQVHNMGILLSVLDCI